MGKNSRFCTKYQQIYRTRHFRGFFHRTPYSETYLAEPRDGWEFVRWDNYCEDATTNECAFNIRTDIVRRYWGQVMPPLVANFSRISPTISGSLSGSIILAVTDNNEVVAIESTSGRFPDVDGNNDGVNDQYSFTLTGLPLDSGIRIFLIEEGATYPMLFDNGRGGVRDANVFALSEVKTIALGHVSTKLRGYDWAAIPKNSPTDYPGVSARENNFTAIDLKPPTDGFTVRELIDRGMFALEDGWVKGAHTYFNVAVVRGSSGNSGKIDLARFLSALTHTVSWIAETPSDGDAGNMDRIGDFLDRMGIAKDVVRSNSELLSLPARLPDGSPRGSEYQTFLYGRVRRDLWNSITLLSAISPQFIEVLDDPLGDGQMEVDYGDVLAFRGTLKTILGILEIQRAYDLDMDVDMTVNDMGMTTQKFLAENPLLLSISPGQFQLDQAYTTLISGFGFCDHPLVNS